MAFRSRRRMSRRVSRRYFSRSARTHRRNMRARPMRGGFRI